MREGYHWRPRTWQPSPRLRAVLDGLATGQTNAQIAASLGVTSDAVKWHLGQAMLETGLHDRRALARWWQQEVATPSAAPAAFEPLTWVSEVRMSLGDDR